MYIKSHIPSKESLQVCMLAILFHYMGIMFGMLFHNYKYTCMNLFTDHRKSYKSDDGNYYTYPRREHEIKRFEKPSIIQIIIRGIVFQDIVYYFDDVYIF